MLSFRSICSSMLSHYREMGASGKHGNTRHDRKPLIIIKNEISIIMKIYVCKAFCSEISSQTKSSYISSHVYNVSFIPSTFVHLAAFDFSLMFKQL